MKEQINMDDFAHHIVAISHKNDVLITDLQLQKVLYFSFKFLMKNCKDTDAYEELLNSYKKQPFLAWKFGPVVRDVYDEFKYYGATPILDEFPENPELSEIDELTKKIQYLLKFNVSELVNKTHDEDVWKKHHDEEVNYKYTIDDILKEN